MQADYRIVWQIGRLCWCEQYKFDVVVTENGSSGRWLHSHWFVGWEREGLAPREIFSV